MVSRTIFVRFFVCINNRHYMLRRFSYFWRRKVNSDATFARCIVHQFAAADRVRDSAYSPGVIPVSLLNFLMKLVVS